MTSSAKLIWTFQQANSAGPTSPRHWETLLSVLVFSTMAMRTQLLRS